MASPLPIADTPTQIVAHMSPTSTPTPPAGVNKATEQQTTTNKKVITLTPTQTPTKANTNTETGAIITATSTITSHGKTITFAMHYPSNGGAITGTMSGDCAGTISGNYAGPTTHNLSGSAKASCSQGLLTIPVTIDYTGKMAADEKQATIHYTVTALGQKQSGTSTLNLTQ
jgi:hypothetical protein